MVYSEIMAYLSCHNNSCYCPLRSNIIYLIYLPLLMVRSYNIDVLSRRSSNFSFHWTVSPMILVTFGGKLVHLDNLDREVRHFEHIVTFL